MIPKLFSVYGRSYYVEPPISLWDFIRSCFTLACYIKLSIDKGHKVFIASSRVFSFIYMIIFGSLITGNKAKTLFFYFDDRAIQCRKLYVKYIMRLESWLSAYVSNLSVTPSSYLLSGAKNRVVIYPWVDNNIQPPISKNIQADLISSKPILLLWSPFSYSWDFNLSISLLSNSSLTTKYHIHIIGPILVDTPESTAFWRIAQSPKFFSRFENTSSTEIPWEMVRAGVCLYSPKLRSGYTVEVPNKTRHYSYNFIPLYVTGLCNAKSIGPLIPCNFQDMIKFLLDLPLHPDPLIIKRCQEYNSNYNSMNVGSLLFNH